MNKIDKLKILKELTFVKGITITQCLKDFDKCEKLNKTKYMKKKSKKQQYKKIIKIKNRTLKSNLKKEIKYEIKENKKVMYIIDEAWSFLK